MLSLVVLCLSSYYWFVLLPHYELVPPRASVAYVQTISNDVARASPQLVSLLVSHVCHHFGSDLLVWPQIHRSMHISATLKVFKASPRRRLGTRRAKKGVLDALIFLPYSFFLFFSLFLSFSMHFSSDMASPRLALPRLTCRLGGKKGVNHRASPYRLKNYGYA
jgi:hypothetical protein